MRLFKVVLLIGLFFSFCATLTAQDQEVIDIEGLKAQLQASNSKTTTTSSSDNHLESQKNDLAQEEAALMKKLENNESQELVAIEKPADTKIENLPSEVETTKDVVKKENSNQIFEEVKVAKIDEIKEEKKAVSETQPQIGTQDLAKASKLEKSNSDLKNQNASLRAKLEEKNRELEETRNRLVIAETQVERLSGILEKMNNQKLAGYLSADKNRAAVKQPENVSYEKKNNSTYINPVAVSKVKEDANVGIVIAQKAHLRSGPSKEDSPIMSVSKGTRLVVETRNNEWYRVITPTGGRAWIAAQMLSFGPGASPGSSSALRIGAYEANPR